MSLSWFSEGNQLDSMDSGSFLVRGNQGGRRDNKRLKNTRFCDHCQRNGHTKDQCFKLVGYLDWYKGPRGGEGSRGNARARRPTRFAANVTSSVMDTPLEEVEVNQDSAGSNVIDSNMLQALAQEMMKLMKGKQSAEQQPSHLSAYAQFAGIPPISSLTNVCCAVHSIIGSWIVDTRASDHMTSTSASFNSTTPLSIPIHVTLADGTAKLVTHTGHIPLNQTITSNNVLQVPEFKYNLLYVIKLLSDHNLCAIFYPDKCFLQDLSTKLIVAARRKDGGLYFLNNLPAVKAS